MTKWRSLLPCLAVMAMPSMAAAAPAWCAGLDAASFSASDLSYAKDPDQVLIALAKGACSSSPDANGNRSQIEAARAAWGDKLGMKESDWADVVAFAQTGERTILEFQLSTKLLGDSSPIDQYQQIKDGDKSDAFADEVYLADALEPKLTEVGRLAVVGYCLYDNFSTYGEGPGNAVRWGMCQTDLDKLDRKKLADQLRGDTAHTGAERMGIRFKAYELFGKLKDHGEKVKKLLAQDPAYKVIFDTAAAAEGEWSKLATANPKVLELTLKLEGASLAQSRRAFEGCDAETTAALQAAVAPVPAKALSGMHDDRLDMDHGFASKASAVLAQYPAIQLAAIPYMLCHPKTGKAAFLETLLGTGPGMRGPRTTAQHRILARIARKEISLDDMNTQLAIPSFSKRPYPRSKSEYGSSFGGVVKTMKASDKQIAITVEETKQTFWGCQKEDPRPHFTGYRIDGSGNVIATNDHICLKAGPVTQNNTWQPFSIEKNADTDAFVKVGTTISVVGDQVIATWSSKLAQAPAMVLGAALK